MIGWTRMLRQTALAGLLGLVSAPAAGEELRLGPPLEDDGLAAASGRQGEATPIQFNNNEQNAVLENNLLNGTVVTGNNSITDHAFENMSGVATVIQNTGNQVVIQDSTMINVLVNQ